MVRNWGDVREVLEDIERDRLEEKLKKLDDNLTMASQLPTTDPEVVAAHEAENRYYEHLLMLIEAGLVQGVKVRTKPAPPPWYYDIEYPRLTMEGHDLLAALRSKTVWAAVKEKAFSLSIPITIELIKTVLSSIAKGI